MKKMYSASEIMDLHLPNMPSTKAAIIKRAEKENWAFAEETGLGGVRRLYEIPARYLVSVETMGLPLETALQAALSAHKAANAMGGISDEQFLGLFKTLCGISQTADRPESKSANTQRAQKAKANKGGTAINIGSQKAGGDINHIKTIKGGYNK
jgi:hypothetical protein